MALSNTINYIRLNFGLKIIYKLQHILLNWIKSVTFEEYKSDYHNKEMKKNLLIILLVTIITSGLNAQVLQFKSGKDFKIVQFTDVHYKPNVAESDTAIILIKEVLENEKPDFVVFTGDLIWAGPRKEAFDAVLAPVIERNIPWAYVNGNHDDEHGWSRTQIMDYLVTQPFCMALHGDKHLKGEGNYIIELRSSEDNNEIESLLYFMDSGAYNNRHKGVGWSYDWFGHEQVEWYRKQSAAYTDINLGDPYRALAFFHIPLAEYPIMSANKDNIIGNYKEPECNGKVNTGMFGAMIESGDVVGTFVGHDHDNDYIGNYMGIGLAYGRYSGGNTVYNNLGLNGCRVITLSEGQNGFSTYIRLRGGEKLFPVDFPESFAKEDK